MNKVQNTQSKLKAELSVSEASRNIRFVQTSLLWSGFHPVVIMHVYSKTISSVPYRLHASCSNSPRCILRNNFYHHLVEYTLNLCHLALFIPVIPNICYVCGLGIFRSVTSYIVVGDNKSWRK